MEVDINTDIVGYGSVKLDGVDISGCVMGVDVSVRVGHITQIVLTLAAPAVVNADANVRAKIASLEELKNERREDRQPPPRPEPDQLTHQQRREQ